MSDLEEALTLRPADDGRWLAFADPRYQSITGMFGGWTAAVLLAAVQESDDGTAFPSAITTNFVGKVDAGRDVVIRTDRVGGGRSIHHWRAEVRSTDEDPLVLAYAMVVLSDRRETDGHTQPVMPEVPGPEGLDVFHPPGSMGERTVHRQVSGYPPHGLDTTESVSWVREITGRSVDHVQLAFLADAYAPRSFYWAEGPRPSATVTMSVYFHGTPAEIAAVGDDYLLNEAVGTRGAMSTSGQFARLWRRDGTLLATTEQLCWFR